MDFSWSTVSSDSASCSKRRALGRSGGLPVLSLSCGEHKILVKEHREAKPGLHAVQILDVLGNLCLGDLHEDAFEVRSVDHNDYAVLLGSDGRRPGHVVEQRELAETAAADTVLGDLKLETAFASADFFSSRWET